MQLTVCVETLFAEQAWKERFTRVREFDLHGIELWGLSEEYIEPVHDALVQTGCSLALFCGNRNHSLIDPDDRAGFLTELQQSILRANRLGCQRLTILSDRVDARGIPIPPARPLELEQRLESVLVGIEQAALLAAAANIELLLEPLNTQIDHPGFTLCHSQMALDIVRQVASPQIKLLYDIYHMQVMEGNLIATLEKNLADIGHIHVADVPGRHEPGTGEIHFRNIAQMLRSNGYDGCIGLECVPRDRSESAIAAFCEAFR